jgi:hypothetical protein
MHTVELILIKIHFCRSLFGGENFKFGNPLETFQKKLQGIVNVCKTFIETLTYQTNWI